MKTDQQLLEAIQSLAQSLGPALADLRADRAKLAIDLPDGLLSESAHAKLEHDRAALEAKTDTLVSDLHQLALALQRLVVRSDQPWPASTRPRSLN